MDYQALLNAQSNPWTGYLPTSVSNTAALTSSALTPAQQAAFDSIKQAYPNMADSDIVAMVAPSQSQLDAVYGPGYSTQPLYHEAFPGYDGTLQSAIQYSDAQMNANKNAGLTNLGLALAGGVTGGLLSQAGLASDASSFGGSPETAVGGSQTFGDGTVLSALNGTPPIYGAPIDVAGNVIGPTTAFGTSSIPFDPIAASLGSGMGSAAAAGGTGAGTVTGPNGLPDAANAPVDIGNPVGGAAAGANVASNIPSWLSALSPYAGLIGAGLGLVDSALQPNSTTQTNQGSSNSSSTSTLQLPSQITGAAGTALDRANQLLTQGQQFAPLPYILNQAAGNLAGLGSNTAPLTSSFANGANINPYLDTEFNAAADATQNRLGSEFANAGQYGSPQNQQARSQELQTLAAGIYGPGYENALGRQFGAQEAGVSRGLQQQDSNLNRTLQSAQVALPLGTYMQQQAQQQANAPYTNLSQYIGQLGALSPFFPGTSTQSQSGTQTGQYTQPLYNNPLTSAIGGASLGSYFGSLFGNQQPSSFMGGNTQSPMNMQIQPYNWPSPYAY